MNVRLTSALVGIIAAGIGVIWLKSHSPPLDVSEQKTAPVKESHQQTWPHSGLPDASERAPSPSDSAVQAATATEAAEAVTEIGFRLTPAGALVIDEQARALIEEIAYVSNVSELYEIFDELRNMLPPTAGAQAVDLIERYRRFRIALAERISPNEVATTPEDAAFALDRLHALRVEFFGAELAERWFSEDEAFARASIKQQLGQM